MLPRNRGWKSVSWKEIITIKIARPTRLPDPSFGPCEVPQIKMHSNVPKKVGFYHRTRSGYRLNAAEMNTTRQWNIWEDREVMIMIVHNDIECNSGVGVQQTRKRMQQMLNWCDERERVSRRTLLYNCKRMQAGADGNGCSKTGWCGRN